MISEVVMPQMGADMVEGTIIRWLKREGDPVRHIMVADTHQSLSFLLIALLRR